MLDESKLIDVQIKDNKVHVEHKDPVQQIKKEVLPTSLDVQQCAKHARKDAHTLGADLKREISMEIKNKLSESFDFIEESCGSGSPEFEFYAEPKMVSEGVEEGAPSYPIIGRASGVFAPIGVMSRNNRIYDNDHYDYLLENQQLVDRIAHRGMLGTIGHHDKKVDDQDLAEGKVSHIVTNLRIVEEADGSRNLYGILEILDTPAGHLLKTYYDSGVPLFVSSRGGGNLLPVPNESYKRVDKTKYFLETFDIVKNPGFLQAKPVYEKVSESVEETVENQTEEIVEEVKSEDKLDKLIESVSSLVSAISEGDKKVVIKQEDGEKKETKETKEAKEAKEAKETKIVEEKKDDKKDKEEDKPEDEKNDDAESAVASSVTEEEKLPKKYQKMVDKTMNPHAGMTKADIANGNIQTKLISMADAIHNAKMAQKADQEKKQAMKELKARATKKAEAPKQEYEQQKLFCSREELINKLRSAIDETIEDAIDKTVKDKNKRQELHNKVMLNKHAEITQAADRRAEYFKGDPKYNTERNQTFTQASPYNDALDQINRNRENKNSYEDRKRQERGSDSDRIYNKIVKRANEIKRVTPQQKASAGKMNYMNKVHDKMNDNNAVKELAQLLKQAVSEGYNLQSVVDRAKILAKRGTLKNGETYSHAAVNNDIQRQKRRKEILSNDDKRHTASYVPDSYMYKRGKISGKVEKDDIFTTTNQKHGSADELAMQRHSSETLKNKAIGRYCKKMNDKNSKIEQALKTIDEADQVLAQPIVAVQNAGNSTKSAQEANPEVKEPVTMDRLELARALKAKVNNGKKVEV